MQRGSIGMESSGKIMNPETAPDTFAFKPLQVSGPSFNSSEPITRRQTVHAFATTSIGSDLARAHVVGLQD